MKFQPFRVFSFLLLLACIGCVPVCHDIEPHITSPSPLTQLHRCESSFPPLTKKEKKEPWGQELIIGESFARDGDFYRAITAFRRAEILSPSSSDRKLQITYDIVLSYYLAGKYQECINTFEGSDLSTVESGFPAFNTLVLILYDAYLKMKQQEKAEALFELIRRGSSECGEDSALYQSFQTGNVEKTDALIKSHRCHESMEKDFAVYHQCAKSPTKARVLNALLPGMGYYYVGQKKSALTSFVINALFTAAAYQFFARGYPAAGAITASLEAGWYFGGINGAGIEAKEYNTRLFEETGRNILGDYRCFPVLMIESCF